jgi:anti-sigma-K factor RskA
MTDREDIDNLAAEYVLGTLNLAERTSVAARRQREPDLEAAISDWELRLAPVQNVVAPVAPPAAVKAAVMASIAARTRPAGAPASSQVVDLRRQLARWRAAAVAAGALAASLVGLIVYRDAAQPPPATSYVAVLQKDAQSPAFLMTVDVAAKTFTVRPVAAEPLAGKSYELWLVHEKLGAPRSLGVVGNLPFTAGLQLAAFAQGDIRDATYAVSLEPEGGSKTGAPTGPVVYAGKLVQVKP